MTDPKHLRAIAAADQENARLRDERATSPDGMTASERAMSRSRQETITHDGYAVAVGSVVFVRCGGEYPEPGRWRVREMLIVKITRSGRLRLEPVNPKRVTGCWRRPAEVFKKREVATGREVDR